MAVKRLNDSVLGALERPTLAWLADHMPAWVSPNRLTLLGIFGAALTAAGFVSSRWSLSWLWLSCFGLAMNWFGDSLDGTLARRRRIERPRYGFFVDHTCDLFSQTMIFMALGVSPCAHFSVACLGLIAFLTAFVSTLISMHVSQTMRITYFGFGPTEIRALLFFGNLATLLFGVIQLRPQFAPLAFFGSFSGYDLGISVISLSGICLIASMSIWQAFTLAEEDPFPVAPRPRPD